MKKILFLISIFISAIAYSQPQTIYKVASIAAMKAYFGAAQRIHVTSTNQDFIYCPGCTPDEITIFDGVGARNWKLTPSIDTVKVRYPLQGVEDSLVLSQSFLDSLQPKTPTANVLLLVGLAAYYKLDEASGNALDAIGLHNGTVNGCTQNVAGKIGTCYTFNGSSNDINIGTVSISSVFTYSAWVKTSSETNQAVLIGKSTGSGAAYFRVQFNFTAELLKNNVGQVGHSSPNLITSAVWNHIAVTYNASGNYIFYVNGVAANGTNLQTFTFGSFLIGSQNTTDDWFNGQIDEVGIWNRALSAAEVAILYNSGTGKTYPF